VPAYLVRTYLQEASDDDVRSCLSRVAEATQQLSREGFRIRRLDSIYVPSDGWLGCLYEADTAVEVRLATERAVMPFDEIVEVVRYDDEATRVGDDVTC
jgi:hypothetical protein